MTGRSAIRLACLIGVGVMSGSGAIPGARAADLRWDDAKQNGAVSVKDRSRDAFRPDGIRLGNYLLFPEIGFGTTVISSDTGSAGPEDPRDKVDLRGALEAGFELRSQYARHMLEVRAHGRAIAYHDREDMRYLDGEASMAWRIDIDHAHNIFGTASTRLAREEDLGVERPTGAKSPPGVIETHGEIGFSRKASRIDSQIGLRYSRWDYQDVETREGARIDLGHQDNALLQPYVRLGLALSPGYSVFGEVAGRFQENRGNALIDRDAVGFEASAGVKFELSPLVQVALKAGYLVQDYRQGGLHDIATAIWDAQINWMVTPLVTLSAQSERRVVATGFGSASGRVITRHTLKGDYEMWRNLVVSGAVGLQTPEYIGTDLSDNIWIGKLGARYYASKHWLMTFDYEHQQLVPGDGSSNRSLDKFGMGVKYRF